MCVPEPRWLDASEMRAWRAFVEGSQRLLDRLQRDLQSGHGLSLADYEILVRLSEAERQALQRAME